MRRPQKARKIQEILDGLYPDVLPPLEHEDPYTLLIAVLLSAQCTDERVNRIAPQLFARAATPDQMISLPVEEIEEIVRPCGLGPRKARAISALSQVLLDEHGGRVPMELEALERLPGVGHKTAQVVVAQAFGTSAFPVDTHIHRLAARWGLSPARNVEQTERDLKELFPAESWNKLHLQIIFFGREHCPAVAHDLDGCLICSWAATKRRKEWEIRKDLRRRKRKKRKKATDAEQVVEQAAQGEGGEGEAAPKRRRRAVEAPVEEGGVAAPKRRRVKAVAVDAEVAAAPRRRRGEAAEG